MENVEPVIIDGKVVGQSFTLNTDRLSKGSFVIAPNTGSPIVMSKEDFFEEIPDMGPMVRPCAGCMKRPPVQAFKQCARCRLSSYCSPECQRAHWKEHKPMCTSRVEVFQNIKAAEAEALKAGKPYYSPLVLQQWYQQKSNIVEYAAIHALDVVKGPRASKSRTHLAVFDLQFDEDRPNDALAVRLKDVVAAPLSMLSQIGGSTYANFQEAAQQGGMVLLFLDTDKNVVHIEKHLPDMAKLYLGGEKKPNPQWKLLARLNANKKESQT